MAVIPCLQTLSAADLDGLIAELKQHGSTELVLTGPRFWLATNPKHWPDDLRQAPVVYQLQEFIPNLVQRLAALTRLTSLDLVGNGIVDLKPLLALKNLYSLGLQHTKVQDLAPLKPLLEAGLEARWVEYGEDGINVYGCPLVHPPPEIVQQGHEAVLNYLREIEAQGEDHLYEAKLLLLSEPSADKTSLLRRLYQPALPMPLEEETTKGIDIHHHEFSGQRGQSFRLNVWDFGGQPIDHATHQFFLTKRSLYVLLDDTRSNNRSVHDEGFKNWLEMIETLSEASPVLIFQNEKAGRSKSIDEPASKGVSRM